jgi:hypothetical protein
MKGLFSAKRPPEYHLTERPCEKARILTSVILSNAKDLIFLPLTKQRFFGFA